MRGGAELGCSARMTAWDIGLCLWGAAALTWWGIAVRLVSRRDLPACAATSKETLRVSIFKPLPVLPDAEAIAQTAVALETFAGQLDSRSELLLGVPEEQSALWQPILTRWQEQFPDAAIKVVTCPQPTLFPNPKIAWKKSLAAHASGEIWLWSDADIIAPAGLLDTLRGELAQADTNAVTCAYTVPEVARSFDLCDALFVNAEFLPGALLLGRRATLDFSFGACVAFRADVFKARIDWNDLGQWLADDFQLGQRLRPVRLSRQLVQTQAHNRDWPHALAHYLRWHKTVRWCRPGGYAAMLVILPLLGWGVALVCNPESSIFRTGFIAQWLAEALAGGALLKAAGCRYPRQIAFWLLGWPLLRTSAWLASWLPLPVVWGNPPRRWHGPKQRSE